MGRGELGSVSLLYLFICYLPTAFIAAVGFYPGPPPTERTMNYMPPPPYPGPMTLPAGDGGQQMPTGKLVLLKSFTLFCAVLTLGCDSKMGECTPVIGISVPQCT